LKVIVILVNEGIN